MKFSTVITALTLAVSISASPLSVQKRSANIVKTNRRPQFRIKDANSTTHVFDAAAAQAERTRLQTKYGSGAHYRKRMAKGPSTRKTKRVEKIEPFDINQLRKRQATATDSSVATATDSSAATATGLDSQATGAGTGLDTLDNANDVLYFGAIAIGNPPQNTTADFDTGSSDLVVPIETCQDDQGAACGGPVFERAASSSLQVSKAPFSIQYADQSGANGTIAEDAVTIAGLTVDKQAFGAVDLEFGGFSRPGNNAALLGLGFPGNAVSQQTPFFNNLAEQGKLASNLFSFFMTRNDAQGSELCLGCMDTTKFTGELSFFPLDPTATNNVQLFWNIASDGATVNGGTPTGSLATVIDSGTSLIFVPTDVATAIYSQIPGAQPATDPSLQGFYTAPCDAINNANVSFVFGGKSFNVDPADFNLGAVQTGSNDCVAGVGDGGQSNLAILGDEFMKNWYSVFDLGGERVGFAQAVQASA